VPDYAVGDRVEILHSGVITDINRYGEVQLDGEEYHFVEESHELDNDYHRATVTVIEKAKVEPKIGDVLYGESGLLTLPDGSVVLCNKQPVIISGGHGVNKHGGYGYRLTPGVWPETAYTVIHLGA
jgi:hypothetical protein